MYKQKPQQQKPTKILKTKLIKYLYCFLFFSGALAMDAVHVSAHTSTDTSLIETTEQYFTSPYLKKQSFTANSNHQLTVKWLLDPQTQQTLFELKQLLGFTIDQKQPLTALIPYGIEPHRPNVIENSYLINLHHHPFWADAQNLFQPLSTLRQLNQQRSLMRKFGFTTRQLKRLEQQLTQYPQQQSHKLNQLILKHYIISQAKQQKWSQTKTGKEFVQHSKHLRFTTANRWAQSTLLIFDAKTQQKLIDYLQQQLRFIAIIRAPISLEEFTDIGGQLQQQHQQFLNCQAKSQPNDNPKNNQDKEPNNEQI